MEQGGEESRAPEDPQAPRRERLEQLLLQYLEQKGYQRALEALRSETQQEKTVYSSVGEMSAGLNQQQLAQELDSAVHALQSEASEEEDKSRKYIQGYQTLTESVYSSLDIYKNELVQVLYPVFVHCYLELVMKGCKTEARKFLQKYKSQHTHFHYEDLLTLQGLTSPDLVKRNELAQRVLKNKFVIRLSQASYELLLQILQDSRTQLLSILNQRLNFKVFKGQPNLTPASVSEGSMPLLDLETTFRRKRKKKSKRRKDEGDEEQQQQQQPSDEDDDVLSRTKKKKVHWAVSDSGIAAATAAASGDTSLLSASEGSDKRRRKKPAAAAQTPVVAALTEAERTAQQLKMAARAAPPALPSSCLYTFFNCRNDLSCVEIAPNLSRFSNRGPIIAAGFSDSSIKCWNWSTAMVLQAPQVGQDDDDDNVVELHRQHQQTNRQQGSAMQETQQQQQQQLDAKTPAQSLIGHSGPVYGLCFSSNQRWLMSCAGDCTARLWNVETQSNVVIYKGHQYPIWDVSFSSLDYLFATASHDRTARIWTTDRISPVRVLAGHLSDVECVRFHPNSNYVATGSSDKTVRLWDVQSGECVRMFIGHSSAVNCLSFSGDGRYLASASDDKSVFVWDLATAKSVYQLKNFHNGTVWSLDFNSEGNMLASGAADCSVKIWHVNRAQLDQWDLEQQQQQKGLRSAANTLVDLNKMNSSALLKTYYTKQTPVYKVKFTERNVLLTAGPFEF